MDATTKIGQARGVTDSLLDTLDPAAWYERPIPERHRMIFYLGHLEAFDWNLIGRKTLDAAPFHAGFDKLFEFGIDPPEGAAAEDRPADWPSVDEVRRYNLQTRRRLDGLIAEAPARMLDVAIEHRLMHAETLAYLLHNLDPSKKRAVHQPAPPAAPPPSREEIDIPEGVARLGQEREKFGWDNEYTQHDVEVPAFRIRRYKVTNAEYLDFVRSGGEPPHFWRKKADSWFYRGMFEDLPLPLDWPVYATHQQANAFAAWQGRRLPTEAEFHRAAFGVPGDRAAQRRYPWGEAPPDSSRGNFDFARWDPASVTEYPQGDSAFGVSQMMGNGWEWTSTVFGPFPGFEPFSFYQGYSRDFFDGNHYVVKGASPRTAATFLRRSFRNWFRGRYPHVYATFRMAL